MDLEQGQNSALNAGENTLVKSATREVRVGFVRKVYGILSLQLIVTVAIAAPLQRMNHYWFETHMWLLYSSVAMTLITVLAMSCCGGLTRSYPTNYIFLFVFTAFEGVLVGFVSATYTAGSVALCAGITAAIFLCLTLYAWTTKRDFTGLGPYLFGMLMSLMVFGLVMGIMAAFGVYTPWMLMAYDIVGILIFVMYIIFDTQLIMGELGGHKKYQFGIDDYVFAALNLYLDIINLFLHLLSLLGRERR